MWLPILIFGVFAIAIQWIYNRILFQRVRLDKYDETEFPIKFVNGISYIYDRPEADVVVIFSHGSSGNLTWRNKVRNLFKGTEYGLIIYDYYGYGVSDDVWTFFMNETTLSSSIEAVMPLVEDKKVILMGASLGSFPTAWMAAQNPENLLGAILCVPFNYLLGRKYNNVALCKNIKVPTLLIKARYDEIMPELAHFDLMDALNKFEFMTVPTKHKDYLTDLSKRKILDFVKNRIQDVER